MLIDVRILLMPAQRMSVPRLRNQQIRHASGWICGGGGSLAASQSINERLPRVLSSKSSPLGVDLRRSRTMDCAGIKNAARPELVNGQELHKQLQSRSISEILGTEKKLCYNFATCPSNLGV